MSCTHNNEKKQKTSDFYRTCNLPERFEYPSCFYGYGIQRQTPEHPLYRTTTSDYGRYPPTVHTITNSFFPSTREFTTVASRGGMYRNYSLNTGKDPN
ncbi:hypothetical protein FQA39_LY02473 [Lamprigera yunnana]|nr:hypothetical protein FQA39_LY02473 [Lamprigera yunnana]